MGWSLVMESANVSRLQKKLQGRKKRSAPFFECFNRWVFLSRHNQIMFQNRGALADLQAEYEEGKRSATSLKKEAQRIVKENLGGMKVASLKGKNMSLDGKEEFNVPATMRQVWCRVEDPASWTCYVSIKEAPRNVLDIYFRRKGKRREVFLYTIVFLTRNFAFRFLKSFCSTAGKHPHTFSVNQPLDGSLGIEVMSLAQTDNEDKKMRVVEKSAFVQQAGLRNRLIPLVQTRVRGYLARRAAKRRVAAALVIHRTMARFRVLLRRKQASAAKKGNRKKRKKTKLRRRKSVLKLQQWYRRRLLKLGTRYCAQFGQNMEQYTSSIDFVISKLRPHYDEVISRITEVVRRVRPNAVCEIFGSYGNGMFTPHSDIDIVVALQGSGPNASPFFEEAPFRMAVPKCVRNVGTSSCGVFDKNAKHHPDTKFNFGHTERNGFGMCAVRTATAPVDPIHEIVCELTNANFVRSIKLIQSSRVPIIKLGASSSGNVQASVDISVASEFHGGLRALTFVSQVVMKNPVLRPMMLFLKQFLLEEGVLNVKDKSGGMTSYALFVLCVNYLRQGGWLDSWTAQEVWQWGGIMRDFFDLYGNNLDFSTVGVSVNGVYGLGPAGLLHTGPCVIDDPVSPGRTSGRPGNLGQNMFRINDVQRAFQKGWHLMVRERLDVKRMLRVQWLEKFKSAADKQSEREMAWPKNYVLGADRTSCDSNEELIQNLIDHSVLLSDVVIETMKLTDRSSYVPDALKKFSYYDKPLPLGLGAAIGAPHMHAYALEFLAPMLQSANSVLDVGSGSGYLSACLSKMAPNGKTVGIDHIEELTTLARKNVMQDSPELLTSGQLSFFAVDGFEGFPENAPYNVIHVGAAATSIPDSLCQQLAPGGRMLIPVGPEDGLQEIYIIDKQMDGSIHGQRTIGVRYVPLTSRSRQISRG